MYTYIVEAGINDKKYDAELARIESRLIELEMSGRIEKLTILKNLPEAVKDAIKNHSETIVLIGTDRMLNSAMSALAETNVTVGIIPLGDSTLLADALGIPYGIAACDILSARITATLDLGKVNNRYFLSKLHIPECKSVTIDCDSQFQVSALSPATIDIANFGSNGNPRDGRLEVIVRPHQRKKMFGFGRREQFSRESVFPVKRLTIRSGGESMPIMSDGETIIKTPATVEIASKKLKIIVGKQRNFA
ncbi:MAG: diacylglycerol kinase family protein [Patescibacteria group bacterium]